MSGRIIHRDQAAAKKERIRIARNRMSSLDSIVNAVRPSMTGLSLAVKQDLPTSAEPTDTRSSPVPIVPDTANALGRVLSETPSTFSASSSVFSHRTIDSFPSQGSVRPPNSNDRKTAMQKQLLEEDEEDEPRL